MNFYLAHFEISHWLLVVVRAETEARAAALALEVAQNYNPGDHVIGMELLPQDGPEEVVLVDDS